MLPSPEPLMDDVTHPLDDIVEESLFAAPSVSPAYQSSGVASIALHSVSAPPRPVECVFPPVVLEAGVAEEPVSVRSIFSWTTVPDDSSVREAKGKLLLLHQAQEDEVPHIPVPDIQVHYIGGP